MLEDPLATPSKIVNTTTLSVRVGSSAVLLYLTEEEEEEEE